MSSPYSSSPFTPPPMSPYPGVSMDYTGMGTPGSYGPTYGGYGMGMYGGGSYGPGSYGGMGYGGYDRRMSMSMPVPMPMPMNPNNPTLTQTLEATTQNTFALLYSIPKTFYGVAQMLESTFAATHTSFFAMVGVADQLGQLRSALGDVLGIFGLRWLRELVTGLPSSTPIQGPPAPKTSRKAVIILLLAIFGVPYAMTKLIRIL